MPPRQSLSEINIRPFESNDAEIVAAMMTRLAQFHHDESHVQAADFVTHSAGPKALSTIWIAEGDGRIVGFAVTHDWMNYVRGFPVRHIDLMFVEQEARGDGVGRHLMKAIVIDAKRAACQRITVGAADTNPDANVFYRRLGFESRTSAQSNRYILDGPAFDRLSMD